MMSRLSARGRMIAAMLATAALPGAAFANTIAGTVTDGSGTRALQSAEIRIVELGRTAQAGSDGHFRFTDVPAGTYTLRFTYTGAEEETRSVTVEDNGLVRADVTLSAPEGGAILVIGQRANLASSISRQRASDTVDTVLTRDAIGQFPDQNVAEALRRAPGINVLNDQGEGRFVSVRGLDPNLNSTSINGNRVLATGGDERAAALDVIPSELVESIEIRKSLTPDMEGDTLGGSIEINTTSAFDLRRGFVSLTAEGSYNDLRDTLSPRFGVDFATRLGDNFGIAGGFSYSRRRFASDNVEVADWDISDDGITFAEEIDYRDYDVTRERIGASLSLEARVGPSTELYLRGLYSRFDDQEFRRRLVLIFNEPPASGTDTTASFDSADGRIEVRRDIKDRGETQTIRTLSFGGRTETGPWRFSYDASYSQARQFEDGSVDPARFRRRFDGDGLLGVTMDYSDIRVPSYSIDFGEAAFRDPTGYNLTLLERTTDENARDREFGLRFDATRSFALANGTFEVQAGTRARFRRKSLDFTIDLFDGYDGDLSLADVVGPQTYGLALIDPVPGTRQWRDFLSRVGYGDFEFNAFESEFVSAAEDYRADEDILAGYILGRLDTGPLRAIAGVRVERTSNTFFANRLEINEDDETLAITPVTFDRDYTHWLPSLNLRFEAARNVLLRGAAYRSIVRPKLADVAPRFIVEENEDGERSGEFGNPDLSPYTAWNFDATVEYYFARNAVVQGGFFHKRIGNFIVEGEFDDLTFNGIAVDEAVIPINGETATVTGFEFAYQQALTFLPRPLDGLLVNFNYTYTDASGRLADGDLTTGRRIPLPSASRHTFNAVLGYERGPISLRFAGAYRSGYLDEIAGDPLEDRYVRDHFQFDITARYRITPQIQLYAELVNALDEPYLAYQRGPDRDRLLQYEEYSWTGKFGVRVNF